VLFVVVATLVTIGVVTVFSASYPQAALEFERKSAQQAARQRDGGDAPVVASPAQERQRTEKMLVSQRKYLLRQLLWSLVGAGVLFGTMLLPLDWLRRPRVVCWVMGLAYVFLVLAFVPGIGSANGREACRWVDLRVVKFQPSETAKFALCLFLAYRLNRLSTHLLNTAEELARLAVWVVPMLLLVFIEPHLGGTLVISATLLAVLLAAGLEWRYVLGGLGVAGCAAVLSILHQPYQWLRIVAWLHPERYAADIGYHAVHCGTALARGGWAGRGLGRGIEKFFYLPECHTDSIVAVLGEEQGFLGCLTVLVLFLILSRRGLLIARHAPDRFAALLATGLTSAIFIQAIFNFGVTSGLLPQTGVGMPFLSYGGSSLCCFLAEVGVLLNISCHTHHGHKLVPGWSPTGPERRVLAQEV
jgi:cell division protein FtsW